jgi:hypothetical protein
LFEYYSVVVVVYYEEINREFKKELMYECRWDERLKVNLRDFTYTVLCGGLEHTKIETRLINERCESVMGEFVIVTLKVCRLYSK